MGGGGGLCVAGWAIYPLVPVKREGAKNSGRKRAGLEPVRDVQVNRRSLPPLAPLSLTPQVCY